MDEMLFPSSFKPRFFLVFVLLIQWTIGSETGSFV
jgi:hypothetical protein